ncbi:Sodium/hydrogen exchanger 7 [Picochlorum sp. SENEW3]|nr:Sodium/hydrogen exchanger 7 [Picochlorum sp. SENEW3]WPT14832.1 Sodium/hydrogen exchanger 7 [Picochlorum sp. SENEW3]
MANSFDSSAFYSSDLAAYSNYTEEQCLTLDDASSQVVCESMRLNVTDPPSIYAFNNYTSTWGGVVCLLFNTTLTNRVYLPDTFNYCTVPLRGYDAFLFASLALLATCFLFGKLSTVYVLISGALLGILNYYVNLLEIGNAVTLWLRIQPADLFFYAFLPPLIVEQAIRIDIYMFRKTIFHSLMLAVVMVIITAIILTSLILFVLGFDGSPGWSWVYGALFASIIAPTDALAVSSILKKVHGPAILTAIMEGESLLNDATGITLFEVFQKIIEDASTTNSPSVWSVIPTIIVDIIKLSSIGFGIGLGFSMISYYIMRWIRWRGAGAHIEATYVLAMAYLSYYITNAVAGGSGVISVVIFGLFGNMTMLWGMTGSSYKSGAFEAVWDMISFAANGLVFFWAGVASLNFLIGSITQIPKDAMTYASIILVYIFMLLIRTGCVALFNPLFHLVGEPLTVAEIAFTGWSGLRGAVSLIMLASLSSSSYSGDYGEKVVISDISLWTASFVVLTLIINAPLIAPLLKSLKLNETSREAKMIQNKAKMTFLEHTRLCIQRYKDNDDVFLAGADWEIVAKYVDLTKKLESFGQSSEDVIEISQGKNATWDDNSYSGVAKAFVSTLWYGAKQIIFEIVTLRIFWKKHDNSDNFSHISSEDGLKDFTDSEDADDFGNNNECHYQGPSLGMSHSSELEEGKNHGEPVVDIESGIERRTIGKYDLTGASDESDQHCLTSESGKKVLQDLQTLLVEGGTEIENSVEEEEFEREELNRNYSSMPAASRQEIQESLRKNLDRQASLGVRQSENHSVREKKHSHPARFQDVVAYLSKLSMSKIEDSEEAEDRRFLRNHKTLNTATGRRLHAELQQQNIRPDSLTRKLDLMGNRANFDHVLQSGSIDTMNSRGGQVGLISHHLHLNSHIDQLKEEFILNDEQDIRTEHSETGKVSGFQENDNAVNSKHSDSALNNSALKEIRHRLIGGLKRRFKQRRIGGKLSIAAYLILEQVCNEKLEAIQDRLDLWELLMRKAREGIVVHTMAYLSYKGTKSFKRAHTWAKYILYYPYSLMNKIFRHYLGKTMLVACEVAIEYHLALSTSEHVKWLKLHDENFWTLLQEVEQEIKKSHDFIIDREVEAPDTFRAIQSYRAALVVLKSMQKFVEDLVDAGVMEENEGEIIHSHVDDKLTKLELTGPVWRPPKFKDIFCTLRPFSGLNSETAKMLWQMGLVQEYKPQQLICTINEQSESLGIFHLLSGVVKSVKSHTHGEKEEYYGHGSCFGLLGALQFAPLPGSESIVAVGNALGRGPIVLRFLQSDIDDIQSLAESGSSDMLELLEGWTRLAALYILENSEESLVDQISKYLDFRSNDRARISFKYRDKEATRSPFQVQGQSIQEEESWSNENIERKPSLGNVLSTEAIGFHTQEMERISRKTFIQNRAKIVAKEITSRIRKLLHVAKIVKVTFGDTIGQTSSIILLSGQLRRLDRSNQLGGKTEFNAPAVIPFLDEYDELMQLERSSNQQEEISWRVASGTANTLQIPCDTSLTT